MKFDNRLEFIDQCVAGEMARFQQLLSRTVFDSFERGYEIYRDYIKQKNTITSFDCDVSENDMVFHIGTASTMEELLTENFPKKGITTVDTDHGMDLHIKLMTIE
ncbi:MAG: hypothetical protein NC548_28815 [Lachnospiraceae bacterium]|nr:hypothetical protein [Lachnospiraceae bacterium]